MKLKPHHVLPGLIMTAATAIPVGTALEMLRHVSTAPGNITLTSSLAALPVATASAPATPVATARTAPASAAPTAPPTATPVPRVSTRTYQGPIVSDQFGDVQATITVVGNRITDVSITAPMNDQRSADINSQATPLLRSETLTAQSASINTVSGATLTSQAYQQSLQAAVAQIKR